MNASNTAPAAAPPSVRGRILPGWFDRDDAIRFLLNDCVFDPAIDADAAEALWRPYREGAEALPERVPAMPTMLPLDAHEQAHAKQFKAFISKLGGAVTDVVKVDPRQLGVIQYYVVTDQADKYAATVKTSNGWLKECLPLTERLPANLQIRYNQHQFNTEIDFDLPHAECVFAPVDPNVPFFGVVQFQRYVSVTPGLSRLYLTAGYHRCFARSSRRPLLQRRPRCLPWPRTPSSRRRCRPLRSRSASKVRWRSGAAQARRPISAARRARPRP